MDDRPNALLSCVLDPAASTPSLPLFQAARWLADDAQPAARAAAAFLVLAAGSDHPEHDRARATLDAPPAGAGEVAAFFRAGLGLIEAELDAVFSARPEVAARWQSAIEALEAADGAEDVAEAIWQALCPQAMGVRHHEDARIAALRDVRTVEIESLASDPIVDPAQEVLFTANVLLTVPATSTDVGALPYPTDLREAIAVAAAEPQRYWFDHPIQIGVEPAANELLYGLRGLDAAVAAEVPPGRVTCLLSVSVTHDGLAPIARRYVQAELARDGKLEHVDVVVVTEADTRGLIEQVLAPALGGSDADELVRVVGVDGRYGRHYSFLKAVAAVWQVAIDPAVRATFKIDLDQVFPQDLLLAETGRTMFGHLRTPLWGASARRRDGTRLELGMLAGALVNERDIGRGLFTPDVPIPDRPPALDEHVFFSSLPQSISTRAEMMERYDGADIDGRVRALERIHVTGGTNGIRVDALRRHRPFTPTWVGRAEDQAYLLSTLGVDGDQLAYVHAGGLIMRHDKEAFAGQAMEAARIGKLIGDDVRILIFSAYVDALAAGGADRAAITRLLDPFTGCFVSDTPRTLTLLRLALRTLRLAGTDRPADAGEYALAGTRQLAGTLEAHGHPGFVAAELARERAAWDDYYAAIDALEADEELRRRAQAIIDGCRVAA